MFSPQPLDLQLQQELQRNFDTFLAVCLPPYPKSPFSPLSLAAFHFLALHRHELHPGTLAIIIFKANGVFLYHHNDYLITHGLPTENLDLLQKFYLKLKGSLLAVQNSNTKKALATAIDEINSAFMSQRLVSLYESAGRLPHESPRFDFRACKRQFVTFLRAGDLRDFSIDIPLLGRSTNNYQLRLPIQLQLPDPFSKILDLLKWDTRVAPPPCPNPVVLSGHPPVYMPPPPLQPQFFQSVAGHPLFRPPPPSPPTAAYPMFTVVEGSPQTASFVPGRPLVSTGGRELRPGAPPWVPSLPPPPQATSTPPSGRWDQGQRPDDGGWDPLNPFPFKEF